jgi:hypothetical protein
MTITITATYPNGDITGVTPTILFKWDMTAKQAKMLSEYADSLIEKQERLEAIRTELQAERISYGELFELADLAPYIDDGDVELLEAAGVPEDANEVYFSNGSHACANCGVMPEGTVMVTVNEEDFCLPCSHTEAEK